MNAALSALLVPATDLSFPTTIAFTTKFFSGRFKIISFT